MSKTAAAGGAAGGPTPRTSASSADRTAQRTVERLFAQSVDRTSAVSAAAAWDALDTALAAAGPDGTGRPASPASAAQTPVPPSGALPSVPERLRSRSRSRSQSVQNSKKEASKVVAFELGASSEPDDMFVKEALPATLPAGSDLLSKTVAASKSRNVLHMVVFLPNRKPIKLTVPVAATVDDVIVATITAHQDRDVQPPLLVYSPRGFELRLHEFDGYPDEDVPALDRNRKIRGFAQGSDHEYCLCELPGAADLAAAGAADPELRVLMPFPYRPSPSVVPISSPSMTVRDVLDVLVARHRLPLWSGVQQFVVRLSTADAARLKAPSKDVPLSARVAELGADKVELVKRGWSVCLCLCVCLCVFFWGEGGTTIVLFIGVCCRFHGPYRWPQTTQGRLLTSPTRTARRHPLKIWQCLRRPQAQPAPVRVSGQPSTPREGRRLPPARPTPVLVGHRKVRMTAPHPFSWHKQGHTASCTPSCLLHDTTYGACVLL